MLYFASDRNATRSQRNGTARQFFGILLGTSALWFMLAIGLWAVWTEDCSAPPQGSDRPYRDDMGRPIYPDGAPEGSPENPRIIPGGTVVEPEPWDPMEGLRHV